MQATETSAKERNEAICAAVASGETMTSVAARYGISRERVRQITWSDPALRAYLDARRARAKQARQEARDARCASRDERSARQGTYLSDLRAALAPPPLRYDPVCALEGCERAHYSRALCRYHYGVAREYGFTKEAA